jgi:hydrogenase maturation factor
MADVDFGFRADAACLLYQPQVTVDTPVLVHMGFVMEELDEKRADEALTLRKEIAGESPARGGSLSLRFARRPPI